MIFDDGRKQHLLLKRTLVFIVLPLLLVLLYFRSYLVSSISFQEGTLSLKSVHSEVSVHRDSFGVPTIVANTDHDAFFAIGFAHAQDRLWQLEFQRRLASGRLSELFGYKLLKQDKWMRSLDLTGAAQEALSALSPEAKASLQAYADGVNAYLEMQPELPPEFVFLDITPEPWKITDSLIWVKFFALSLAKNVNSEIQLHLAKQSLTDQQITSLFPEIPTDELLVTNDFPQQLVDVVAAMQEVTQQLETDFQVGGKSVGSNAWVVSGSLTDSGMPILANDPHLGLQIPSLWYAASIKGAKLNAEGMTLVGLPLVVFGHNQSIAWGGTNMMADVQDLSFELVNPNNPTQYKSGDTWKEFETKQEVIYVRPETPSSLRTALKPVILNVRKTERGPIISDSLKGFEQPLSLQWVGLTSKDTTYDALFALNYAGNYDEFKNALSKFTAPALNFLYADIKGNIAYQGAGRLPQRNTSGLIINAGWEEQSAWQGYVPFDLMPSSFNPQEGYIYQANNSVVASDPNVFISYDFADPARAERIDELLKSQLKANQKITSGFMQKMQTDTVDLSAKRLLPILSDVKGNSRQNEAIAHLARWNGDMNKQSSEASLFHVWVKYIRTSLIQSNLNSRWGNEAQRAQMGAISAQITLSDLPNMLNTPEVWCANSDKNISKASCDSLLLSSLDQALDEVEKFFGSDLEDWEWGELQHAYYAHSPFSDVRLLNLFFERKVAAGGSSNAINVATSTFNKSEGYLKTFGAGFRYVIDITDEKPLLKHINAVGQSGHFMSRHYDDMIPLFQDGELLPLPAQQGESKVLKLIPTNSSK